MSQAARKERIVIVGAGPGGLATALLLARTGASVTVLERGLRVGGRTSALEMGGFRFDRGPTFFLYPEPLQRIFASLGLDLEAEVPMVRLDPQYRISFASGGHLDATPDVARMQREIAAFSPADAAAFPRFLDENRSKLERFRDILQSPFHGWRSLLSPSLVKALPFLHPTRSLDIELRRFFKDERMRLAFSFQSKYLGMSPYRCPSLFSILSFLEYEHGVFHPLGGCSAITEGMARIARDMGVDVRLGCPVKRIRYQGQRAVGVVTPEGTIPCDALVLNADFAHAMKSLVPAKLRRRWSDRRLRKSRFSCSTFMLYLGVKGEVPDLAHHTIHISEDYRGNLRDIEKRRMIPRSPSFYVQNPSVTDLTLAPPGHSSLYVLVPVPNQASGIDWAAAAPGFRERILEQVEALGVPHLRDRIVTERMVTPAHWEGQGIHLGATFNLAHDLRQMLHLRPRNRFEDLDGVYLTGGGTHPGSGLPVIFESAHITSRLIREDLELPGPDLGDVAFAMPETAPPLTNRIQRGLQAASEPLNPNLS